jgi:hypothetical protein
MKGGGQVQADNLCALLLNPYELNKKVSSSIELKLLLKVVHQ